MKLQARPNPNWGSPDLKILFKGLFVLFRGGGAGNGSEGREAPHRLSVDARPIQVQAEEREGPTQWRPPSPSAAPSGPAATTAPVPSGPVSALPVGAGPDLNSVPWDLAGPVRQYFTPDTAKP